MHAAEKRRRYPLIQPCSKGSSLVDELAGWPPGVAALPVRHLHYSPPSWHPAILSRLNPQSCFAAANLFSHAICRRMFAVRARQC